ncbi:hypothetical protein pEaSNUABM50_00404 [Erwinia phage pEa_SNUABM_50]|uniref:Phage protein n=4 Tax=Eneladusvirus BF TaxID=2560751 RepID=A0A7L8ZN19_9CAUD|nr:hypothetical protein FDH34_gp516 [Serratia phage BF]QOI71343.1 hypothetical protein pEaSNUABM12_00410 [Erwinia phage pEa_SNUABM_12]QOI71885.1 hypothetical protein pEaSNUABM47_00406 [Erwinia phage pEa_SNUABM_47]QOI72424.1 hypothetical protein pEaSNUABM50_00404 [Erwinia phage pEa_SNUABM_50]QXO11551.1 hypothetical protein pEaSNUABM19_00410 [Erwinia phage pEa_SNUABM_19]QXO12099.1 hypothetical protein pEaSNUABM44_00408 [Erwinia phage pEa_SNUABM_44]
MTVQKFEKLPIQIDALEWTGNNLKELKAFASPKEVKINNMGHCKIETLEGWLTASIGDMIIKGVQGEIYPCKPDVFALTYRKIEE